MRFVSFFQCESKTASLPTPVTVASVCKSVCDRQPAPKQLYYDCETTCQTKPTGCSTSCRTLTDATATFATTLCDTDCRLAGPYKSGGGACECSPGYARHHKGGPCVLANTCPKCIQT